MQVVITRKEKKSKEWQHTKSIEVRLAYNEAKKKVKMLVNKVK